MCQTLLDKPKTRPSRRDQGHRSARQRIRGSARLKLRQNRRHAAICLRDSSMRSLSPASLPASPGRSGDAQSESPGPPSAPRDRQPALRRTGLSYRFAERRRTDPAPRYSRRRPCLQSPCVAKPVQLNVVRSQASNSVTHSTTKRRLCRQSEKTKSDNGEGIKPQLMP